MKRLNIFVIYPEIKHFTINANIKKFLKRTPFCPALCFGSVIWLILDWYNVPEPARSVLFIMHVGTGCMTFIPMRLYHVDMIVDITSDIPNSNLWENHE